MTLTKTQARILELWSKHPGSRTKHRDAELTRLVLRDLRRTARNRRRGMTRAYYNEHDAFAAAWLRELISDGLIAPGDVDERDIQQVQADDLRDYTQCHFFAGIGGWSLALQLAGWPESRPVWTGSCPCQPYSVASVAHGGAQGQGDERDLWPDFFRLVRERKPPVVFGEQVASAIPWGWWDRAAMDLEGEAFACAAAVLRADAVGAAHERKRLYWLADAGGEGRQGHQPVDGVPFPEEETLTFIGDPLAGARRALDGDYSHLLRCDGLPIVVERHATKGYGNAIVPQVAAQFIGAYLDTTTPARSGRDGGVSA